jgi:nicotinate phosphoribosyltransferase
MVEPSRAALLTDLYQLTMLQAYVQHGMEETAVFEFFVRKMPPNRGFLIAAGLQQALEYLEGLRFSDEELEWLRHSNRFSLAFVEYLGRLRFTGEVHAMPEGTPFFPDEPIVQVIAPLPQAQLVETRLMNLLHYQTLVASKAARSVLAAAGKPVIDFGLRRAHGAEAGLLAARATYLVGFAGTATVLAESMYGIPAYGTMAHSFVQAHTDEPLAFEHFATAQPDNVVLVIDTYNIEAASQKVVSLAAALKPKGIAIKGVRLDSGDLEAHARKVRRILDDGGLNEVQIIASGNLDEHKIQNFVAMNAPIDVFAVGTSVTTSADAPYLDCVYKLQEYAGRPRRKRSEGKATWPGRKQVYRQYGQDGRIVGDILTLADDKQKGEPLLQPVMVRGRGLRSSPWLAEIRARAARALESLPEPLRALGQGPPVPVEVASALSDLAKALDERA